ncbi:hypothetical protein ACJX0J_012151, partial [Zea mays]
APFHLVIISKFNFGPHYLSNITSRIKEKLVLFLIERKVALPIDNTETQTLTASMACCLLLQIYVFLQQQQQQSLLVAFISKSSCNHSEIQNNAHLAFSSGNRLEKYELLIYSIFHILSGHAQNNIIY